MTILDSGAKNLSGIALRNFVWSKWRHHSRKRVPGLGGGEPRTTQDDAKAGAAVATVICDL